MAITNSNLLTENNTKLSIQISLSGLSFCILNTTTNTITHLKSISLKNTLTPFALLDNVKQLFNTEPALNNTFNFVQAIHISNLSALVPAPLFNSNNQVDYLKFNTKILKSDFVTNDTISINNSVNVYIPFVNINNFIFDKFGTFNYKHFSTVLIETILKLEKNTTHTKCYVHIAHNHFEIIIVSPKGLEFYNTFKYNTPEDYIYYLLFTLKQLHLNPETLNVILIGAVNNNDKLYTITYKYIRHVNFGKHLKNYTFKETPTSNHSHFTLINSL